MTGAQIQSDPCPICAGPPRDFLEKHGWRIVRCQECGHLFVGDALPTDHLHLVYSDEYFVGGGAGYPGYLEDGEILRQHGQRYGRLLAKYVEPAKILDVGSAAGFILQGLTDSGWEGQGLEPNSSMAEFARVSLGLQVDCGSIEGYLPDEQFNVVSMIQVVAHFNDLRAATANASEATRPGGLWLIETWNRESRTAKIFGKRWHEFSPPSVLHWFSPEGLSQLASQYGFSELARGRPRKRISSRHIKSLLRHVAQDSLVARILGIAAGALPDSLVFPYPSEDLFWMILRKDS